jgi:trans-2,3-dihydro-3-hydroxyanthranilate isomerase
MSTYRYLHLDVFTDTPFEGNQLAVFPEPRGLTTAHMQTIAREMNFSESTFVFPPESGGDIRMRIFTPGAELPMAGHPTIGTTFALALEGTIARGRPQWVFELGVGPISVSLEWDGAGLSFVWMTQLLPVFGGETRDLPAVAAALGVSPTDIVPNAPAQSVSCGLPFFFVPLVSRAAVDSVAIDRKALAACYRAAGLEPLPVFVFTRESGPPRRSAPGGGGAEAGLGDETVYSRMLAADFGIAEDPATGGASGPLGCYLLQHAMVTAEQARQMVSLQGVAMGRPSRIHISIDSEHRAVTRVRVGGRSVLVGRGELQL